MKTKYFNNLILTLMLFAGVGCEGFLNKDSINIIPPDKVWEDPKLINAVLVGLYDKMQFEDFNYYAGGSYWQTNLSAVSDESQIGWQAGPIFDNANATWTYDDEMFGNFSGLYTGIRSCNDFLAQLEIATLGTSEKEELQAEVRFIRAWHYFSLVKRYGGVPLIIEPQEYTTTKLEDLQQPRSKEEDVYNFIITECKEVAGILPSRRDAVGEYRVTKGAAWALCSRAALYAGSIARYGEVELDGVTGITAGRANDFFQIAYDASQEVIGSGLYQLYDVNPDKAENFRELFMKGNGDKIEYILLKAYDADAGKGHDHDKMNAPYTFTQGGWGCITAPVLELVEAFEYIDGSEGTLKLTNDDGTLRRFKNLLDLYEGKDPRLFASIFLSGTPCKDNYVIWQRGVIDANGNKIVAAKKPEEGETYTNSSTGKTYSVSGKDGGADVGDPTKTSFYQRKFWDDNLSNVAFGKSSTPRPVFRLAEMYLNAAEAAFELGKVDLALAAINPVRTRAGIKTLTFNELSLDRIRNERKIELAFEGSRYWDLKRWRIASLPASQGGLEGFRGSALYPWLDTRDEMYVFERNNRPPKQTRSFLKKHYYIKINADDMNSNPKLVQNPGHTN